MRAVAAMSRGIVFGAMLVAMLLVVSPVRADSPRVTLDHDASEGQVKVHIRGEHFTTLHYGDHARTPYLWPVIGEGGVGLTRNYPMDEDELEQTDHPHHRSLWLVFGEVNGYDQWHEDRIETEKVETGTKDDYAYIRAHNDWLDSDGQPLLREVQELRFRDQPASARLIELKTTFEAAYGDVTFADDPEGFMALRIRPELTGDENGVITRADGVRGEGNIYGSTSPWMSYSGELAGHGHRGIAIFDHPENFRQGYWHTRDYGLLSVNPFAKRTVGGQDADGSVTIEEGESLTLRYAWFVYSGLNEQADVAGHYEQYVSETGGEAQDETIKALYVTGGGWHDYEAQEALVTEGLSQRVDNIDWTIVHEGDGEPDHLVSVMQEEDWAADYDVVVHNHGFGRVEDAEFVEHMVEGHLGTPAVIIHAANHSFRYSDPADPWFAFLGIQSMEHESRRPIIVENLNEEHSIMSDFPASWDTSPVDGELYVVEEVWGQITPLAEAYGEETETEHVVAWKHKHEDTRVFSTTLGHYNEMYEQDEFMDMLGNALTWAIDSD